MTIFESLVFILRVSFESTRNEMYEYVENCEKRVSHSELQGHFLIVCSIEIHSMPVKKFTISVANQLKDL